jgi:hypothetical protein
VFFYSVLDILLWSIRAEYRATIRDKKHEFEDKMGHNKVN